MKKYLLLFAIVISSQLLFSQNELYVPIKKTQKSFGKIDFLSIKLPNNNPELGLTGVHYNLLFKDWAYAGIGLYGAVSGNKGGFFTLGINAGIKKHFTKNAFIDAGFHFGGGGGAFAPDGGGAFILPHASLGYNFRHFILSTGWSYINFFDKGKIRSQQLKVGIEIPLEFNYADYSSSEREITIYELRKSLWNKKSNLFSVMVHLNNLKTKGKSRDINGNKYNGETIRLAGIEIASFFNNNLFGFAKIDGAYNGIEAGYLDFFLGAGYLLSLNKKRTRILGKLAGGTGGGGGVDTKGGFLIYADLSIEQILFNDLFISINKGFIASPDGSFSSSSLGLGLKYYMHKGGITADNRDFRYGKLKGLEVIIKQDMYFNAKKAPDFVTSPLNTNLTENLHQISLQINLGLNKHIYLAGQASFANFGNAGSYTETTVGAGIKSLPLFKETTTFFTQFLAGGAGGGNISTGEGVILKPSLGLDYKLNNNLSLRSAFGYIKAERGELNSSFVNFGLKYNISFLKM